MHRISTENMNKLEGNKRTAANAKFWSGWDLLVEFVLELHPVKPAQQKNHYTLSFASASPT